MCLDLGYILKEFQGALKQDLSIENVLDSDIVHLVLVSIKNGLDEVSDLYFQTKFRRVY